MNKKSLSKLLRPRMEVLYCAYNLLQENRWEHPSLRARFWRLYSHDKAGATIRINGEELELLPETLYLIPPNLDFSSHCAQTLHQLAIHFVTPPLRGRKTLHRLDLTPDLKSLVEPLKQSIREVPNPLFFHLHAMALVTRCLTLLPLEELYCGPQEDLLLYQIDCWISNFYEEPLPVPRLARTMMVNEKTLTARFKDQLGITPYQFVLKRRYEYAAQLLVESNFTISEICQKISVNDPFHFSRTFHRRFGCSPTAYRTKKRREAQKSF